MRAINFTYFYPKLTCCLCMKLIPFYFLCLLFSLQTPAIVIGSGAGVTGTNYYAYNTANKATLFIEFYAGDEEPSYSIKVERICSDEFENIVGVVSKSLDKNLVFIYNCYGDFYELESADSRESNSFFEYIKSHSIVDIGGFVFNIADYGEWERKLRLNFGHTEKINDSDWNSNINKFSLKAVQDSPKDMEGFNLKDAHTTSNQESANSLNSLEMTENINQLLVQAYSDGWNDGKNQLLEYKPKEGLKAGEAQATSKKESILLLLIISVLLHFYKYFAKRMKKNIDDKRKVEETNSDLKRIVGLENKLEKANVTIKRANERVCQLKVLLNENISSKGEATVLKNKVEALSEHLQKLNKENEQLKADILNKKGSNLNISAYLLLGVSASNFDFSRAKLNYKKLSQIYHPDKSGSQEMMKKLNEAYSNIRNH